MSNYNENGQYDTGKIQWVDKAFPESVEEILLDDNNELADEYGRDILTNDEDDNFLYVFFHIFVFYFCTA